MEERRGKEDGLNREHKTKESIARRRGLVRLTRTGIEQSEAFIGETSCQKKKKRWIAKKPSGYTRPEGQQTDPCPSEW